MKSKKPYIAVPLLLAFLTLSCVTKRLDSTDIPPNVRTFYFSKKLVWKHLIQIIRNEYLIPFDYASFKRGNFACKEVKIADNPEFVTKFRLSGSVTYDGSGIVVSLFNQQAFWDENQKTWKNLANDFVLETRILKRLDSRLDKYRKK